MSSPAEAGGGVDVRVWGAVGERLIEVDASAGAAEAGLSIEGLPAERRRTTADRVRAAIVISGLLQELSTMTVRLSPPVCGGFTGVLDLPIAIAVLGTAGRFNGVRWVFASGRLGLDGSVYSEDLENPVGIVTAVTELNWRPE